MFLLTLCATLIAEVPAVTAGPDLADAATLIDAPIAEVTVYGDRARVRRRASPSVRPGAQTLRWPDLPGATLLQSVRVTASGGKVLRHEAVAIDRERVSIDQADALLDRLDKLTDEIALLDAEREVSLGLLALLAEITPAAPVPEAQREGRPAPPLAPDIWRRALDFLANERLRLNARARNLEIQRREKLEKVSELQRNVQRLDLGGFSDKRIQALTMIEAPSAGKVELELEYFVPGASWKPAYDLHFDPDEGKVRVETQGMVSQATGEDWRGVTLDLSTAIPGQTIDLPELLTWTLGEAKEFVPVPRAKNPPPPTPQNPPPRPIASRAEQEKAAKQALLQSRLAMLRVVAGNDADSVVAYSKQTVFDFSDLTIGGELAKPEGSYVMGSGLSSSARNAAPGSRADMPPPAPPPPPRAAEPMPASPSMDVAERYAVEETVTIAAESRAYDSEGGSGAAASYVTKPLALFEPPPVRGPQFADLSLPAMAAGGLDYVYRAAAKMDVPSTGERLRAPLGAETYPVATYYEASPSLATTAYLEATVENKSDRPILTGGINVFVKGKFTGDGIMKTTGPGGKIELPLGADEDIRLLRKVIPTTETSGLFSKHDITLHRVVIEVANYKKRPVRVTIFEPLPKTRNEDIEIELVKINPKQAAGPDADGILQWRLDIAAGKKATIELEYKIDRPADWQLYQ